MSSIRHFNIVPKESILCRLMYRIIDVHLLYIVIDVVLTNLCVFNVSKKINSYFCSSL